MKVPNDWREASQAVVLAGLEVAIPQRVLLMQVLRCLEFLLQHMVSRQQWRCVRLRRFGRGLSHSPQCHLTNPLVPRKCVAIENEKTYCNVDSVPP